MGGEDAWGDGSEPDSTGLRAAPEGRLNGCTYIEEHGTC